MFLKQLYKVTMDKVQLTIANCPLSLVYFPLSIVHCQVFFIYPLSTLLPIYWLHLMSCFSTGYEQIAFFNK
jgi:hypothetical protein